MKTLTFNNKAIEIYKTDDQIWITSSQLADALGYKQADSITKIYNRNSDEFTSSMSLTVKLTVNGINGSSRQKDARIFSLRGCHLVAMFARTKIAKEFRKWVLDVLDHYSKQNEIKNDTISISQQYEIQTAISEKSSASGIHWGTLYTLLHHEFKIPRYQELKSSDFDRAIHFIKGITKDRVDGLNYDGVNIKEMCMHIVWVFAWWKHYYPAIQGMNSRMTYSVYDRFTTSYRIAREVLRKHDIHLSVKDLEYFPWEQDYYQKKRFLDQLQNS